MARPIKNTADYFPHDTDMRNDPKVKAIRRKYGIEGYGIYCMAIEYIGDSEHFTADISTLGIELMAGDFDADPGKLIEVLQYCASLDLVQIESGNMTCKELDNRLSALLSKRERDRGELSLAKTPKKEIIASESTQSKVKESKVKEIQTLSKTVFEFLERKGSNTAEITSMIQQWVDGGHGDILDQLKAMKSVYARQGLAFPTRITTLTQSFQDCDWVKKLQSLDPEKQAEHFQKSLNDAKRTPTPDLIGSSQPGSLG